ncbi:MAG: hypothetical protein QFX40_06480 [Archaeoglobales archaeon]|nr:hypothetical protein [Archaeoglobales archaeon]
MPEANDVFYIALSIATQIWMLEERRQMVEFVCSQLAELEECSAVVMVDKEGEFYSMKENVLACEFLRYHPRSLSIVDANRCKCEKREHELLVALSYNSGCGAYVFLKKANEETIQVIKDVFDILSRAIALKKIQDERVKIIERLQKNLEYFAHLSDRIRNPLAVIMGAIEIGDEIGKEKVYELVWKNALKIKETLDELSDAELKTKTYVKKYREK